MISFSLTSSTFETFKRLTVAAVMALSVFSIIPAETANAQYYTPQQIDDAVAKANKEPSGDDGQSGFQKSIIEMMGHVLQAIQSLFSVLVYAGGLALNASIYYSVVKMGEFMNTSPGLAIAWGTFRDVGNIVIVFGFIAIGIRTILNAEQYQTKKLLATLLIVAIAINFSSFISRAIVDTGNVVALQFYKAINGGQPVDTFIDVGISGRFIEATKLMNIYDADLPASVKESMGTSLPIIAFMSIILYIVVAFVFFAIAILFISRMVILLFLITISPLAFAAMAIPSLKKQSEKFWKNLIDNTIVAPLLILLLWVSIKVVGDGGLTSGLGSWSDVGTPVWANVLIMFGITCGFFLASLFIAKNLSSGGADFATSMGGKIAFGTAGWAARQTLGRAGAAGSRAFRRTALGRTDIGRIASKYTIDKVGTASFDMRNPIKSATGVDIGKGNKGGRTDDEKDLKKTRLEYSKTLSDENAVKYAENLERPRKIFEKIAEKTKINRILGSDAAVAGAAVGSVIAPGVGTLAGMAAGAGGRMAAAEFGKTGSDAAKAIKDRFKKETPEERAKRMQDEIDDLNKKMSEQQK